MSRRTTAAVAATAGVGGLLYTLYTRWAFSGVGLGFWDLDLQILQDRQLFTFVLLPAWIVGCLVDLRFLDRRAVQIRLGSVRARWWSVLRDGARRVVPTLLALNLGAVVGSLGLPLGSLAPDGLATSVYRASSLVPLAAWGGSLAVLALGLIVVSGVLAAVSAVFGSPPAIGVGVGIWVFVLASFQFDWATRAMLEAFIVLAPTLEHPTLSWRVPLGAALVLAGCLALAVGRDRWIRGGRVADVPIAAWIGVAVVAVAGAALIRPLLLGAAPSAALADAFFGPGGTVLQSLVALILVVGPAGASAFALLAQPSGFTMAKLVRYGSPAREFLAQLARSMRLVLVLALAQFSVGATLLMLVREPEQPARVTGLLLAVVASGGAATLLVFAVLHLVLLMRPRASALALAVSGVVSMSWVFPGLPWNPFALHGARLAVEGRSAWTVVAVLAVSLAPLVALGVGVSRWRRI